MITTTPERVSPLRLYAAALAGEPTTMITDAGDRRRLPVEAWSGTIGRADWALLRRCSGPTLDLGCGPGRLTTALQAAGTPALGVDLSGPAVDAAVGRGAVALRRDLFAPLPAEGRWHTVLLADDNIGIGGDAIRLLTRCRALLAPGGRVLLDLAEPGTGYLRRLVRLVAGDRASGWFPWCWLDRHALAVLARPCGLRLTDHWVIDGRQQAELIAVGA
ncbi:methyltransferase domain-containing protein [Microlunatus speluncae]|uniref:methyltransferase domain-containing protein n=1 Tax=Microlunatus speluncae TaxID=2594267 RepID=UPI0012667403|nr:methyltransferase domain-containing protein [Microlunatus speluncae]